MDVMTGINKSLMRHPASCRRYGSLLVGAFMLVAFFFRLNVNPAAAQTCADTLTGADGSIANAQATPSAFADTGASASLTLDQPGPVLVVASYFSDNIGSSSLLGSFQLSDGTTDSQQIDRYINNPQDYGIGSLVHIFQGSAGLQTYHLQHATDSQVISTTGTIVAVSLSTSGNVVLDNDMAVRNNIFTHASSTYTLVPSSTITITLATAGDIYVASSLSANSGTGGTGRSGNWKLQYRAQGVTTWSDLGYAVQRKLSGSKDTGAVSLMAIADSLSPGTYEFSIAVSAVNNLPVDTFYLTHVGVALTYIDGTPDEFSSFEAHKATNSTTSATLVNAVGRLVNTLGSMGTSDVFLGAQYQMTTLGGNLDAAIFDLAVDDGTAYSSLDQWRHLQNSGDIGSGASYGLAQGLSNGTQYAMRLRFAANGSTDVRVDNHYLLGFSLTSSCLSPTALRLSSMEAAPAVDNYGRIAFWMPFLGVGALGLGLLIRGAKRRIQG